MFQGVKTEIKGHILLRFVDNYSVVVDGFGEGGEIRGGGFE